MKLKSLIAALAATLALATPALAEIMIHDSYARASSPMAKSGAAFVMIHNHGVADHLIGVKSDIAARTELHTHLENAEGVMQMVHVEEGFEVPKNGMLRMERGGKHIMFMGLTQGFVEGETVTVTLIFRDAGEMTITIPIDLQRDAMNEMDHSAMDHGAMDHSQMDHSQMHSSDSDSSN